MNWLIVGLTLTVVVAVCADEYQNIAEDDALVWQHMIKHAHRFDDPLERRKRSLSDSSSAFTKKKQRRKSAFKRRAKRDASVLMLDGIFPDQQALYRTKRSSQMPAYMGPGNPSDLVGGSQPYVGHTDQYYYSSHFDPFNNPTSVIPGLDKDEVETYMPLSAEQLMTRKQFKKFIQGHPKMLKGAFWRPFVEAGIDPVDVYLAMLGIGKLGELVQMSVEYKFPEKIASEDLLKHINPKVFKVFSELDSKVIEKLILQETGLFNPKTHKLHDVDSVEAFRTLFKIFQDMVEDTEKLIDWDNLIDPSLYSNKLVKGINRRTFEKKILPYIPDKMIKVLNYKHINPYIAYILLMPHDYQLKHMKTGRIL